MPLFKNPVRRFRKKEQPHPSKHFQKQRMDSSTCEIRRDLDRLRSTIGSSARRKEFTTEMNSFLEIYTRYAAEKAACLPITESIDIQNPPPEYMLEYSASSEADISTLSKLAILRTVKSSDFSTVGTHAIKDGMSSLDLVVQQIDYLNVTMDIDIPLILLIPPSFRDDILPSLGKWSNKRVNVKTLIQPRFPKLYSDSLLSCAKDVDTDKDAWYSTQDGYLYRALFSSGLLDQLLSEGKEFLFIAGSENVGAGIEGCFLKHMTEMRSDFLVEVINKPLPDAEDEFFIVSKGSLHLLKRSVLPSQKLSGSFFTGNIWVNMKALKERLSTDSLNLPISAISAGTVGDRHIVQLEMSAGEAIHLFKNPRLIRVPSGRYLPVKTCSDLLLLSSDVYSSRRGNMVVSENRTFKIPVVKLGERFKTITEFYDRFKGIPSMIELDHLTVTGDVHFGKGIILRGTVIIIADEGQRIDIPSGCILENRLLTGSLAITEL
ncbi:UTP-glucose-1-phosphate uridylyltransferase [Cyathus striatus]|nr:UTP-glucose-1-phosphate uridylyltransferase [Cyathus striatus]